MKRILIISDGTLSGTRIVDLEKGVDVKPLYGTSVHGTQSTIVLKFDEGRHSRAVVTIERHSERKSKVTPNQRSRSRK